MLNLTDYSDEQFSNDQIILKKIIDKSKFFLIDFIDGDQDTDYRLINPDFVNTYREYKKPLIQILLNRFKYIDNQFIKISKSGKKEFFEVFYTQGLIKVELEFKSKIIDLLFLKIYDIKFDILDDITMWNKVKNIPKRNIPANIYKIKKILDDLRDLFSGIDDIFNSLENVSIHAHSIKEIIHMFQKILKRK